MKQRRVVTAGTFDCLHHGHTSFLGECARLGDVTVALNTDEFVATYKGQPPVCTYKEREAVLAACRYVQLVVPQDSDCLAGLLERTRPDYLVIGSDWARKDYYRQIGVDQDWLDNHAITLAYVPYTSDISTTVLRQRILDHARQPRPLSPVEH